MSAVDPSIAHDTDPGLAALWIQTLERLQAELPEQQYNTWIRPLPPAEVSLDDEGTVLVTLKAPNRFILDWVRTQYSARLEALLSDVIGGPFRLDISQGARAAATLAPPGAMLPPQSAGRVMPANAAGLVRPPVGSAGGAGGAAAAGATSRGMALPPNSLAARAMGQGPGALQRPADHTEPTPNPLPPSAGPHTITLADLAPHTGQAHAPLNGGQGGNAQPRRGGDTPQVMGLNSALTFDNLVPGRANQMARTAALHVAGTPGHMYNPLFIYGGVGLGKTHLMNAVGNQLLKDKPDARILYLHAEKFISDVVKNYQRKTFDELKAKYHSLDLLLIDDVQFFAGKDRTQEEFFNAFEALLAKKAHIIMTSDTYPKGLANIDERLTSRFDSGLTVAIEPPELEMRVAILIKKAAQEGIEMPEDVAFFVAKNVRANVRELEGALRKVLAFAKFSHKEITIHLARESLKDLLSIQNRQISVENIQKTVADFYKIKVADMYSKKRPASIARPRQIAMYLAKELTQKSLPEIGELFGGRDHTTVLHAVRKIMGERGKDTELNQQLHVLEQTLKG
ncbi:chromosomal replication initiator protein DnaA [Aquabacterium lacunae]|uniref:Chromosomal replication initiator protein DnaA n=1 Tax=Aquabacterium lacunae TaxID=2528630 RepID=A0A4Q9H2S5_9BURK|nr:chromosomal replication initiator protein DnaA [Aquabacterium lacunae]TBO28388.1 chromosomal replication initiator protein DnaA [Aquabacterium lacunae]